MAAHDNDSKGYLFFGNVDLLSLPFMSLGLSYSKPRCIERHAELILPAIPEFEGIFASTVHRMNFCLANWPQWARLSVII